MWIAWLFIELLVLAAAVWLGAQIAQIEYADYNRCFTVAFFALVFSGIIKLIFGVVSLLSGNVLIYALA